MADEVPDEMYDTVAGTDDVETRSKEELKMLLLLSSRDRKRR